VEIQRFRGERIIIHTITRQKAKWIVTSFVGTAFKHVIEIKIRGKNEREGKTRKRT